VAPYTRRPRAVTLVGLLVTAPRAYKRVVTLEGITLASHCWLPSLLTEDYKILPRARITERKTFPCLPTIPIWIEQKNPSQLIGNSSTASPFFWEFQPVFPVSVPCGFTACQPALNHIIQFLALWIYIPYWFCFSGRTLIDRSSERFSEVESPAGDKVFGKLGIDELRWWHLSLCEMPYLPSKSLGRHK
jgi:hypothetical protein